MSGFFEWLGNVIKSCFSVVIDFIISLWDMIWGLIKLIGSFLLELFDYVFSWVEYGFYSSVDWVLCQLMNFLSLITTNFDFQMEISSSAADTFLSYVAMLDAIFPLATFFTCCSVYFSFLVVWTIYRFVKSWIPTVSG